ncbi:MAG TPA: 30S ribosomal protein S5 [Candidatus Nanoarchaeia archaeon]|nr:30S ribosomal protein S5 [Candidatus Nanoarchaeia archaeon]
MAEDIKKTAEAYETVSEEKALEESKNAEKASEKMIDKEKEKEEKVEADADKEKAKKFEEKEEKEKEEKEKPRRRRGELTTEEIISAWNPKTKLGKDVKDGKIKNIDEILLENKKILEPEIVNKLINVKSDLISMGQAKGKFGGGKRRAWRQTQRITREGGVLTFSAMAIVGDENGHVGLGTGKSNETLPARDKSTRKAKLNLIKVKRGCSAFDCSCDEPHSIPFEVEGKSGSVTVKLIPAPQGTGLVVANELKKILKMAGIKDVYSQTFGKVRTTFNTVKACLNALEKTTREDKK